MEGRSGNDVSDPEEIARLRVRADAGDRNAAGRLGELLAEDGDLEKAVSTWKVSDEVWQNPAGLRKEYLSTLDGEDRLQEEYGDPEDWAFIEEQQLTFTLARRGDEAAIAELRAQADAGFSEAAIQLRWLAEEADHKDAR